MAGLQCHDELMIVSRPAPVLHLETFLYYLPAAGICKSKEVATALPSATRSGGVRQDVQALNSAGEGAASGSNPSSAVFEVERALAGLTPVISAA
jgi:hypothetical protein